MMATQEELAAMSGYVYHNQNDKFTDLPKGWSTALLRDHQNPEKGFFGEAYVNKDTGEVVIAYRGSDDLTDWTGANRKMIDLSKYGGQGSEYHKQMDQAWALYEKVKQQYPDAKISVTGHSLGGALAQVVEARAVDEGHTVDGATYGAYGMKDYLTNQGVIDPNYKSNLTHYTHEKDVVTGVGDRFGYSHEIDSFPDTTQGMMRKERRENLGQVPKHPHSMQGYYNEAVGMTQRGQRQAPYASPEQMQADEDAATAQANAPETAPLSVPQPQTPAPQHDPVGQRRQQRAAQQGTASAPKSGPDVTAAAEAMRTFSMTGAPKKDPLVAGEAKLSDHDKFLQDEAKKWDLKAPKGVTIGDPNDFVDTEEEAIAVRDQRAEDLRKENEQAYRDQNNLGPDFLVPYMAGKNAAAPRPQDGTMPKSYLDTGGTWAMPNYDHLKPKVRKKQGGPGYDPGDVGF